MIARHIEATGIPTINLTSALSITTRANTPRAVLLDVPLGHTAGPAGDPVVQLDILRATFEAAVAMTAPGSVEALPWRWVDDNWKADPLGWSRRRQSEGTTSSRSGDTRQARTDEPRWQSDDDRVAADAVSRDAQCEVCLGVPALATD